MSVYPSFADYSSVKNQSAVAFNAAMPPLLRSYGGSTGPVATLSGGYYPPYDAGGALSQSASLLLASALTGGGGGGHGVIANRSGFGRLTASTSSRSAEASLLRREIELRSEFHRLRAEEQEQSRLRAEQQRRDEGAEERQRLIAMAREIEEARAKRVEEQQERLLQRERELEEWKVEKLKEADTRRQKQQEEEDRRRELQYHRELSRIKEEADARAASKKQAEDLDKLLTKSLKEAQESMSRRLQDEVASRDAAHRSAAQQREQEWTQRVEALEVARASEMANLTHRLQQDQDRATRSEHQLSEARDQLQRLITEIEGMRTLKTSASTAELSLAETHKMAIARLQQMYEDDKREAQRAFLAERDRLKYEQDRRVDELKEHHGAQLRTKNEELDSVERKLAQTERELQEVKAKSALGKGGNEDPYGFSENTRLKDEVRALKQSALELEDQKKRLERRLREADERADTQAATLQNIQKEYHTRTRQDEKEMEALRQETQQARTMLNSEREAHEGELARLRKQIRDAEEAAAAQSTRESESAMQKLKERHESERQRLESEKQQLSKMAQTAEESLSAAKWQTESAQRELTTLRESLLQKEKQLDERVAAVRRLEGDVQSKSSVEFELREAKGRCEHLQEELKRDREHRQAQHDAVVAAKEQEVQDLHKELSESRRLVQSLREEMTNSKFGKDEFRQKQNRELTEKESQIAQLRRDLEVSRRGQEEWKAAYEHLQRQKEKAVASFEQTLLARDSEVREANARLNKALEEKSAVEVALRTQETRLLTNSSHDGETQRMLREREDALTRQSAELKQLRDELAAQKRVEQELRQSVTLSFANASASLPAVLSVAPPLMSAGSGIQSSLPPATSAFSSVMRAPQQASLQVPAPVATSSPLAKPSPLSAQLLSPHSSSAATGGGTCVPLAVPSLSVPQPSPSNLVASQQIPRVGAVQPPQPTTNLSAVPSPSVPVPVLPLNRLSASPVPMPVPTPTASAGSFAVSQPPSASSWLSPPSFSSTHAAPKPTSSVPVPVSIAKPTVGSLSVDSLSSPLTIPVPTNLTSPANGHTATPTPPVVRPSGLAAPIPVSVPVPAGTLTHSAVPVPIPMPMQSSYANAATTATAASANFSTPRQYTLGAVPVPTAARSPPKPSSPAVPLSPSRAPAVPAAPVSSNRHLFDSPPQTQVTLRPSAAPVPVPVPSPSPSGMGGYFAARPAAAVPTPMAPSPIVTVSATTATAAARGWPTIPVPGAAPTPTPTPGPPGPPVPVPVQVASSPSAARPVGVPVPVPIPVPQATAVSPSSVHYRHQRR